MADRRHAHSAGTAEAGRHQGETSGRSGIVLPDYVTGFDFRMAVGDTYELMKAEGIRMIRDLRPGVTEWIAHPSVVTDELKAFHEQWEKRGWERAFWNDVQVKAVLAGEKIHMIGWKDLQQLQTGLSP
ncbi:ChbG/HpnK family deacetylase [Cohnella kolymensis]|uniref:ChbG/HpnK family deacetylase n=1 Tax=Cohnella kolymensis TaxID=1590652 RepID=UPI002E0FE859